jgi:hypothetical protein
MQVNKFKLNFEICIYNMQSHYGGIYKQYCIDSVLNFTMPKSNKTLFFIILTHGFNRLFGFIIILFRVFI